jgi:hypothetical protein
VVLGVTLHLGIDLLMAVRTFSYQMYVLYLLFRDEPEEEEVASGAERAMAERATAEPVIAEPA